MRERERERGGEGGREKDMKCSWQRRNARQTEKDTGGERTDGKRERAKERKRTETDKTERGSKR